MYAEQLVEKAIQQSLRKSLRSLAAQMGISSGILCEWKQGIKPIPDERIRQLAKIAKVDPGEWLLLIHMEAAPGELGREWRKLAIRLGVPMLGLCVAISPFLLGESIAYTFSSSPAMYIMLIAGPVAMAVAMMCGRNTRMMIC